ncbi:hypothetical protein C4K20_3252 [Pseudomonas chlororaphis subsp. aurantiaca]|nr:hypothetical protein C4K20_3252 [Pseudomonas chlororaphis subsp. aurantiaca]
MQNTYACTQPEGRRPAENAYFPEALPREQMYFMCFFHEFYE